MQIHQMRFLTILCLSLLAACNGATEANEPSMTNVAALPADAVILPAATIPAMLRQCSRQAPTPGDDNWQPTAADIAVLETTLAGALQARSDREEPD